MKLASLFMAATMAASVQAESLSRGLQTLAQKWNITDPTFDYSGLSFDLDYQVSNFIANDMASYTLWNVDCQEGGVAVNNTYIKGVLTGDNNAVGDGSGERSMLLNLTVVPSTITQDAAIYSENNTAGSVTATISFCVRFSLKTGGSSAIEVNFLESLVTLNVDLSSGFSIAAVTVAPKNKLQKTANQVYQVEGFLCDNTNTELSAAQKTATRNQGAVLRVCVRPDTQARTDGIKMRSIDSFTWTRDTVTQAAVTNGGQASNGLTTLTCSAGSDVCNFESILFAAFYTSVGTVAGAGVASMQFGARRLRALQQQQGASSSTGAAAGSSEFNLNLDVVPSANGQASSASSVGIFAAAALGMVATLSL